MIKWKDICIKKKFMIIFFIQTISLIGFAFCTEDNNFFIMLPFVICFLFIIISKSFGCDKRTYFIYSVCVSLFWLSTNFWYLIKDFNIGYDQLKNYSGITFNPNHKYSASHLFLNESKPKIFFDCSPLANESCFKEVTQYFGVKDEYGKNISVKYVEFSVVDIDMYIIPTINNKKVIYEIKHNDKIIYSYDYFISKFSKQQQNLRFFAVYLILNSMVFCILYHLIQKNFVEHS
ncbi:MAG: hypothetical protein IKG79_02480 [Neisseriaceae bacterium]|nr:hypothetical protein [Neisseriaceae bacterium]